MPRFRRKAKDDRSASDAVDLSESEHAWWATGRVQHTYGFGPEGSPPVESETGTPGAPDEFEPWTFDDVFSTTEADFTTKVDDGAGGYGVPDGPDGPVDSFDPRDLAEVFVEEAAYRTLGLEPGATWDDVALAHRKIAKRFHPDRLIHADDADRAEGEEQMRAANAAYEELRKRQRQNQPTQPLFRS